MTKTELHSRCDEYWKALMPAGESLNGYGWIECFALMDCWRQDKVWIDNGCVLLGNINGDGKYPPPPAWWPIEEAA